MRTKCGNESATAYNCPVMCLHYTGMEELVHFTISRSVPDRKRMLEIKKEVAGRYERPGR